MIRMYYDDYLRTQYWKAIRRRALIAAEGRCEECGRQTGWDTPANIYLEVHHLTYERLGHEEPEDLVVLCTPCHKAEHGRSFIPSNLTLRFRRRHELERVGSILNRLGAA